MSGLSKYSGQTERSVFTLEQARVLSSAIRSDVFWAFNSNEPLSAADVASALGKSAQTIHYHVHELVEAGLILAVETRKKRARTESLYVHASLNFVGQGVKGSVEFRQYVLKAFAAITRSMVRDEDGVQKVLDAGDEAIGVFNVYRRESLRLSPERSAELRRKLDAVLSEAVEAGDSPEGVRVNLTAMIKPTQAESRHWLARLRAGNSRRAKSKG